MTQATLASMRVHYASALFDMEHCTINPLVQFGLWFDQAVEAKLPEPNAMVLATSTKEGKPSARVVLLKECNQEGFVFYTNYESHKGKLISENNEVALVFNWLELHRQIRIEGVASKVSTALSTEYFQSRPRGSQVGAWASPQSSIISSREDIEVKREAIEKQFSDMEVLPLPPFWGGYLVIPNSIEFWQGRPNRLHDRILYTKEDAVWIRNRLAP